METNFITIEQLFDGYDHSIITKRTFLPIQGFVMTLIGVALFSIMPFLTEGNDTIFAAIMMLGLALCIWGLLNLFIGKMFYIYLPTMSKIHFREYYFEQNNLVELKKIIDKREFNKLSTIVCKFDKGIKLRIGYCKDRTYSVAQICKFVPYEYKTYQKVHEFQKEDSENLVSQIIKL